MQANESNTMKQTLDMKSRPVITDEQKARLNAIATMQDERIDYSDTPCLPDAEWVKSAELPDAKRQITLRIDADVLDFSETLVSAIRRALMQYCAPTWKHTKQARYKATAYLSGSALSCRKRRCSSASRVELPLTLCMAESRCSPMRVNSRFRIFLHQGTIKRS